MEALNTGGVIPFLYPENLRHKPHNTKLRKSICTILHLKNRTWLFTRAVTQYVGYGYRVTPTSSDPPGT
jgi:hypothetical protein